MAEIDDETLRNIKANINKICAEVNKEENVGRMITTELAKYISGILESLETNNVPLEEMLEKVKSVSLHIKQEYNQDIIPQLGNSLLKILGNIRNEILQIIPKETSEEKPSKNQSNTPESKSWNLSKKELEEVDPAKAVKLAEVTENPAEVTNEKTVDDN